MPYLSVPNICHFDPVDNSLFQHPLTAAMKMESTVNVKKMSSVSSSTTGR